ncbi:hypothetical protein XELAEV_18039068mg [Xenopus laevis]|uniref:Uncharacterized protein n=1 Tax=Xenopus laevis TaxID=8355 RepID=A0A974C741_XENLA|nr:hypothetical protein XELAEV_18039068mg [Xenopus laevis]
MQQSIYYLCMTRSQNKMYVVQLHLNIQMPAGCTQVCQQTLQSGLNPDSSSCMTKSYTPKCHSKMGYLLCCHRYDVCSRMPDTLLSGHKTLVINTQHL